MCDCDCEKRKEVRWGEVRDRALLTAVNRARIYEDAANLLSHKEAAEAAGNIARILQGLVGGES